MREGPPLPRLAAEEKAKRFPQYELYNGVLVKYLKAQNDFYRGLLLSAPLNTGDVISTVFLPQPTTVPRIKVKVSRGLWRIVYTKLYNFI